MSIISKKQLDANRRNAQHSTGPTTEEGKRIASLNAVTYGLRTRALIINGENIADYWELWDGLENEWQPATKTERLCVEQMCVCQWQLARMAASEQRVLEDPKLGRVSQFDLLDRIARHITRLERSFASALHELKQLQKERKAAERQQAAAEKQSRSAPPPSYKMPDDAADSHAAFCAPSDTDSR